MAAAAIGAAATGAAATGAAATGAAAAAGRGAAAAAAAGSGAGTIGTGGGGRLVGAVFCLAQEESVDSCEEFKIEYQCNSYLLRYVMYDIMYK